MIIIICIIIVCIIDVESSCPINNVVVLYMAGRNQPESHDDGTTIDNQLRFF